MGKGDDASFLINFFRGKLLRLTEKEGDLLLLEILSWQPLKRSVSNTHINFPNRKKKLEEGAKRISCKNAHCQPTENIKDSTVLW